MEPSPGSAIEAGQAKPRCRGRTRDARGPVATRHTAERPFSRR